MLTPKERIKKKNQSLRKGKTDFYTIVYLSYYSMILRQVQEGKNRALRKSSKKTTILTYMAYSQIKLEGSIIVFNLLLPIFFFFSHTYRNFSTLCSFTRYFKEYSLLLSHFQIQVSSLFPYHV